MVVEVIRHEVASARAQELAEAYARAVRVLDAIREMRHDDVRLASNDQVDGGPS